MFKQVYGKYFLRRKKCIFSLKEKPMGNKYVAKINRNIECDTLHGRFFVQNLRADLIERDFSDIEVRALTSQWKNINMQYWQVL